MRHCTLAHFHRVSVKEEGHNAVVTHERAMDNYQENIVAEEQRHRRRGRENIRGKPQRWPAEACGEARLHANSSPPSSDRNGGAIPHGAPPILEDCRTPPRSCGIAASAARRAASASRRREARERIGPPPSPSSTFTFLDVGGALGRMALARKCRAAALSSVAATRRSE